MRFFKGLKGSLAKFEFEFQTNEMPKMIQEWKSLDPAEVAYWTKRKEVLGGLWFYNRLFFRLGNYIGKMEGNRLLVGYFVLGVGWTLLLTVIVFALEYRALEKIASGSFQGAGLSSFGQFLYFSFAVITTTSFGDIIPVAGWAKFLTSLEVLSGILIAIILFLVFTTVTVDRYRKSLDEFAGNLLKKAEEMKTRIETEEGHAIKEIAQELLNSDDEIKPGSLSYKFFKMDEEDLQ